MPLCRRLCLGSNLRSHCFAIAYLNLIAAVVDVVAQVVIVFIVTNGFQCDRSTEIFQALPWSWLWPVLMLVNLGTHGFTFFPTVYPLVLVYYNGLDEYMRKPEIIRCYPGMLHLNMADILFFLINTIWLKFVLSFVVGIHKNDPKPMRNFVCISMIKLGFQVLEFCFRANFDTFSISSIYRLLDICIAMTFLIIVNTYVKKISTQTEKNLDQPPSYIQCLINGPVTRVDEKKDVVLSVEEPKIPAEENKQQC